VKLGMFISDTSPSQSGIADLIERAQWAEHAGLASGWVPYVPWSLDAMVALTIAGRETSRIELGTAVVPTYPFHPQAMARGALSVNAATAGRVTLGIGPSHPSVIEKMYGYSYERAGVHTREYVEALHTAFAGTGQAEAHGDFYNFASMFSVPDATAKPPGLLLAALAPYMLRLAGERADGTILWLADELALETHVLPRITAAAAAAGRPSPRVVVGMPIAICDDLEDGRENAARIFATYAQIPTYNRILERGADSRPEHVLFVGDEAGIATRLRRYAELGATDVLMAPFAWGAHKDKIFARTREFLASIVQEAASW
jgi:F420-dependent oxidoreductase-like protein